MRHFLLTSLLLLMTVYGVISQRHRPRPTGGFPIPIDPGPGSGKEADDRPKCMLGCSRGYVPGTCLCQPEPSLFPFLFPATPCKFAICPKGKVCQMEQGRAVCAVIANNQPSVVVCNLPADPGPCEALLPRFFFDKTDGTCKLFNYGGCQGNENRFLSKSDCENRCIANVPAVETGLGRAAGISAVEVTPPPIPKQNEVCLLPAEAGRCFAYIPSFFFNSTSGQCQEFVYGGCGGNLNRFSTLQACQAACEGVNTGVKERPVLSPNHYCNLPKEKGPCRAFIPAFYYNMGSGQCESFIYGGCRGNTNNFESKEHCELKCRVQNKRSTRSLSQNPVCLQPQQVGRCRARLPRWFFNQQSQRCQSFFYGGCGGNDNRFLSLEDCELNCTPQGATTASQWSGLMSENSDCNLPKVVGFCKAYVPSFFYNTNTGKCEFFVYGGCQGNANRFDTKQNCEQKCKQTAQTSSPVLSANSNCNLPKVIGNCKASMPSFYYNANTGQCEFFIYGGCQGNANRFDTKQNCEQKCKQTSQTSSPVLSANSNCNLPKVIGNCKASMPSFYYNTNTGQCEFFIYGGCQGNANRFDTRQHCERSCSQMVTSTAGLSQNSACLQPRFVGPCRARIPRWFFSQQSQTCQRFFFGGCLGNSNNFRTEADCQQRCISRPVTDTTLIIGKPVKREVCSLPRKVGYCRAAMPRFYFNTRTGRCEGFIYGGCRGNANNFPTLEACMMRCQSSN